MSIAKEAIHIHRQGSIPLGIIAAGWLAKNDATLSTFDISKVLVDGILASHQDNFLISTLQRLDALRTIRAFSRQRSGNAENVTPRLPDSVILRNSEIWWNDLPLGTLKTLFLHILPQEAQARLSYETFLYRFLSWLERHCGTPILETEISNSLVTIFIPDGVTVPDIVTEWQRFVIHAFSASELQKTFVLLLNSIPLTSKGFSVPDMPVVTRDQTDILIALFYAILQNIGSRLKRYEQEMQDETTHTDINQPSSKEQIAVANKVKKRKEQLEKQHNNYDQALSQMSAIFEQLRLKDAKRFQHIQALARVYTPIATGQLNARKDIIEKAVTRTKELLLVPSNAYFAIPPLLSYEASTYMVRYAGDAASGVCYACGRVIPTTPRKEKKEAYTANKLILRSPSQTLQGHVSQVQPEVCPVCAVLALACPIKMTDTGLVISLYEEDIQRKTRYLYEHRLRMLTTGEQNTAAGRYLMIPCNEKGPKRKPLIERMGGLEYALLKVASIFTADVLTRFRVEAMFGSDAILLKRRYLVALRYLLDAFTIRLDVLTDNQHYGAVADAVRYVEHDHLIFAIYRLLVGVQQQSTYSNVQRTLLEDGLTAYKKGLHMDEEIKLEQRFCHIAGLTGVLFAFVSRMRSELTKASQGSAGTGGITPEDIKRELKKLIEQVDNPNRFTYEAADRLPGQLAQLWRTQQTHFIYDQARKLLQEAEIDVSQRETLASQEEFTLKLYYDDLNKLYALLYGKYYTTEKTRRDFDYELKLSLYSRFPDLRPGNQ